MSTKGQETKLRILQAAADLFHKHGIRATSPDEIIEASGTGKGQFYHYFKSKDGLVHEVLLWHANAIKSGSAPINYEIASWEELEQWFRAHIELQKSFGMNRGCPFGTAANEVTEDEELIRQDLNLIFEMIANRLRTFFVKEKVQGRLSSDASEERLADFCITVIQGAMLIGKVKRDSRFVESAVQEALVHLKSYCVPQETLLTYSS
ncbi:MAG: TetR/AcrR family transcriptional regulator [Acidobacteriota bacterium]|nr:TetR/AcrR family transcriptional regulator [Acidobacteriota bacterium]